MIGDAAGLVDPFSGDGIYEGPSSRRGSAPRLLDVLAGRADTLEPYDRAITEALARTIARGWRFKRALDRSPRLALALVRVPSVWPRVDAVVPGERPHPGAARVPIRLLRALAH